MVRLSLVFARDGVTQRIWCVLKHTILQITRVQSIHDKSLIYRDIKPDNFLIGLPGSKNAGTIYVRAPLFLQFDHIPMH